MIAAIRIRSTNSLDARTIETIKLLRLKSENMCVILPNDASTKGMLQKSKDYITWGEVSKEMLVKMLKKRLRTRGGKRVDEKSLKELSGFDSYEKFAAAIDSGEASLHKIEKLQSSFRLTPPTKGFRSTVNAYPKGDLGYRGGDINRLLERMI